jgi:acetyl esterase/lipase
VPLDPGAARLLRMLASATAVAAEPPSPEARRRALRDLAAVADDPSTEGTETESLRLEGVGGGLAARLYRPLAGEGARGLVVYLHGGGWVSGDLETHAGVCRALAQGSGACVLAVDYRRPPEHRFPTAVEDAAAAVLWAHASARGLGADPDRLVLAGDSAGGNIAAAATGLLAARQAMPLQLLVLICPILELAPLHPSRQAFAEGYFIDPARVAEDAQMYLEDLDQAANPLASPLRIPDLSGFPPVRLHLAEFDPFRDEGLAFADRLAGAGVLASAKVHPGMIHYFYALARAIPKARTILAEIGAEIGEALGAR